MGQLFMRVAYLALFVAALAAATPATAAQIVARISLSDQSMRVLIDGWPRYTWKVSTARRGYVTPVGVYRAQRLEEMWYSRKYEMSPMPHSIFFNGGYAIHGTYYIKRLGTPASHGCVRLHPDNAATLYSLVRQNGMQNVQIIVSQ
jgi:lipoprotein-anchoring transpeptidase ErfK/SrfK